MTEALTPSQTGALSQFAALYRQHLDDENNTAYPAAQAMLPPDAMQTMGEDMMQRRGVAPSAMKTPITGKIGA